MIKYFRTLFLFWMCSCCISHSRIRICIQRLSFIQWLYCKPHIIHAIHHHRHGCHKPSPLYVYMKSGFVAFFLFFPFLCFQFKLKRDIYTHSHSLAMRIRNRLHIHHAMLLYIYLLIAVIFCALCMHSWFKIVWPAIVTAGNNVNSCILHTQKSSVNSSSNSIVAVSNE